MSYLRLRRLWLREQLRLHRVVCNQEQAARSREPPAHNPAQLIHLAPVLIVPEVPQAPEELQEEPIATPVAPWAQQVQAPAALKEPADQKELRAQKVAVETWAPPELRTTIRLNKLIPY